MKINIFRNPFIDVQVGYFIDMMVDARRQETEEYWRNEIAQDIGRYAEKLVNSIEIDENNIHHGEHMLKYWVEYITSECERIARNGS